jgi:hypothetical protein
MIMQSPEFRKRSPALLEVLLLQMDSGGPGSESDWGILFLRRMVKLTYSRPVTAAQMGLRAAHNRVGRPLTVQPGE